jgi:hypothetical protein
VCVRTSSARRDQKAQGSWPASGGEHAGWTSPVRRVSCRAMLTCPHCGEPLETFVDPGGGSSQEYVEDCAVCCRPIRFFAVQDADTGEYDVRVDAEI